MNRSLKFYMVLLALFVAFGANAEKMTFSKDDFVGSWKLYVARPSLEVNREERNKKLEDTPFKYLAGDDEKKNNEVWTFKSDGTFELLFDDPRASSNMTSRSSYIVEGDTLKIAKIGRVGKYSLYKVISMESNKMILKSGVYYFFTKQ